MKYLISLLSLVLVVSVVKAMNHTTPVEAVKWDHLSMQPLDRIQLLEGSIIPNCKSVYIYVAAKGLITHAFCINEHIVMGFNTCEIMNVDFHKGFYTSFYGENNRLIVKGSCDLVNLKKLSLTVKRQRDAMASVDSKLEVISDLVGFKTILNEVK